MTTPEQNSEWLTRKRLIDPKLKAAGWDIRPFSPGMSLDAHRNCAITEFETANGPADYALCVDGKVVGIVEAKKLTLGPQSVLSQAERYSKGVTGISIWLVTFALTVFADLTVAVEAGMILAALLFISRVAATTTVSRVTDDYIEDGRIHILQDKEIPYYATIFRIHRPFLFGATDKISVVTESVHKLPPVVILRLRNMTALDATGLLALEEVAKELHTSKRTLILCGAREQPGQLMHQAEFEEVVGAENICENVQAALRRAEEVFEHLTVR